MEHIIEALNKSKGGVLCSPVYFDSLNLYVMQAYTTIPARDVAAIATALHAAYCQLQRFEVLPLDSGEMLLLKIARNA